LLGMWRSSSAVVICEVVLMLLFYHARKNPAEFDRHIDRPRQNPPYTIA
jgi:hypothetical protein